MTTPADTRPRPVWELLLQAAAYWRAARVEDSADCCVWAEALDALLDRLLEERPDLRAA